MDFEPDFSSSVSIDGEAIRRIREVKRLTQLYVSKVVGVTTDTVSRWENNRYPTIRRDNALKLAEALEVELENILQQEAEDPLDPELPEPGVKKKSWPLIFPIVLLVLVVGFFLVQNLSHQPPILQASRLLPAYAAPGSRILVRVKISAEKPLKGMILREKYPAGWSLVESEPPASSLDNLQGVARWIFRDPEQQLTVSYMLQVSEQAEVGQEVSLQGELITNPEGQGSVVPLETVGTLRVKPLHWADSNGNYIIDDMEILEVSDLLEETGQLHLEWDLLEEIWTAGGYRWEAVKNQFMPLTTVPATQESTN